MVAGPIAEEHVMSPRVASRSFLLSKMQTANVLVVLPDERDRQPAIWSAVIHYRFHFAAERPFLVFFY
jgi:hypothetical protein